LLSEVCDGSGFLLKLLQLAREHVRVEDNLGAAELCAGSCGQGEAENDRR
jgi:hypothetical protein